MTNHELLAKITGEDEPIAEEAVKMLISRIHEDVQDGHFELEEVYFSLYKGMKKWLNEKVDYDLME